MKTFVFGVLGVALVAFGAGALIASMHAPDVSANAPETPKMKPFDGERDVAPFSLVDHHGEVFDRSRLLGRWTLVTFGFTSCPDACPTTMAKVARAYREAGPAARNIPTLNVSVDPRDTPAVLKQYLGYFRAVPAKGLTGSKAQIDAVVKQFGARYEIRDSGSAAGPVVDHTIRLYLLDRDGDVVQLFDPEADAKDIAAAMTNI